MSADEFDSRFGQSNWIHEYAVTIAKQVGERLDADAEENDVAGAGVYQSAIKTLEGELRRTLDDLERGDEEHTAAVRDYEAKVEALEKEFREEKERSRGLQRSLADANAQLAFVAFQRKETMTENNELWEDKRRLQEAKEEYTSEYTSMVGDYEARIKTLEDELRREKDAVDNLRGRLTPTEDLLDETKTKLSERDSELRLARQEVEELRYRVRNGTSRIARMLGEMDRVVE